MSRHQMFAKDGLEKVLEDRLRAAVEHAKFSVLNGKGTLTDETTLTQQIVKEFALELVEVHEDQMSAELVKVNDNETISIEFLIPITGCEEAILKHVGHGFPPHKKTFFYNPISIDEENERDRQILTLIPKWAKHNADEEDVQAHRIGWISFVIKDHEKTPGSEFANLARVTLENVKGMIQSNNSALDELNTKRIPSAVKVAILQAKSASLKLEETQAALDARRGK